MMKGREGERIEKERGSAGSLRLPIWDRGELRTRRGEEPDWRARTLGARQGSGGSRGTKQRSPLPPALAPRGGPCPGASLDPQRRAGGRGGASQREDEADKPEASVHEGREAARSPGPMTEGPGGVNCRGRDQRTRPMRNKARKKP